ncbi:MAG: M23 family metallopeptidase [Clostridia bacterium]|nr:M23 family metallopeptidase [Clostridia bacterium]
MKIFKNIGNKQGMYRIGFTVCILIMSLIVVSLTENSNQTQTQHADVDNSKPVINSGINDDDIDKIVSNMQPNENLIQHVESKPFIFEEADDTSFAPPVCGKILKQFSDNLPLYSKTMDDWRIHVGVDILCPLGTDVFSAADGLVADIGYDMNFGNYITVESNQFSCRYASVEANELITTGTKVSMGQKLGTLADSCVSEICDEPHLHFEMKKDGLHVDPSEYILFE